MSIIGHRGAKGEAPENTIGGFLYALEKGVTHFELDIRLSADGLPVVIHDATTRRTTRHKYRVEKCSAAQLASANAAAKISWPYFEKIPTLYELAPLLENCGSVQLEIKTDHYDRQQALLRSVGEALRHCDPQRYTITSVDKNILTLAAKLLPEFRRGLVSSRRFVDNIGFATRLDCELLVFHYRLLSAQLIGRAHQAGLEVSTYTTNDTAKIRQLRGWGIDSIITDFPIKHLHLQGTSSPDMLPNWPLKVDRAPFIAR
jgi:glycerophosphoryl diester phosphodiesterase